MKNTKKMLVCILAATALSLTLSGCGTTKSTASVGSTEIIPGTTVTREQYQAAYKRLHGGGTAKKSLLGATYGRDLAKDGTGGF